MTATIARQGAAGIRHVSERTKQRRSGPDPLIFDHVRIQWQAKTKRVTDGSSPMGP